MKSIENKKSWLEEISIKSNYSKDDVLSVINKYDIKQNPNAGSPKHLQIQKISFSGTKEGKFNNSFDFEFKDLKHGVYGIISDENLRGKTTVLEVIKWLLRGSSSSLFQPGVKNWIHKAEVKFKIDENPYSVKVEQTQEEVSGFLYSHAHNKEICIAEFFSNDEFESCMSDFMIKEFSLDNLSAFRSSKIKEEVGHRVNHSWASLAAALFISTNYSSLFGDTTADGLNNRLLNMYLGLPWISTFISLKTWEKQLKSEVYVRKIYSDKELERKRIRYEKITKELLKKGKLLQSTPNNNEIRFSLKNHRDRYGIISRELTDLDRQLRILYSEHDLAKDAKINDAIRVNNFKEDMAANIVFKRLNPTCCPHCEEQISKEKIDREKNEHLCAICNSPMLESEDATVLLEELEHNSESSQKTYDEITRMLKEIKSQHNNLSIELDTIQNTIVELENELNQNSKRLEIEKDVTRLEILSDEYRIEEIEKNGNSSENTIDEEKIIKIAIQITKKRFETLQINLLKKVSSEILRMSKFVGLTSIQSVKLSSVPNLFVEKDGQNTSYSKCSEGEKLRLKVITTIALLSVAEKEGVGRHPGLLLIDSPGAQEVSEHDLNMLIQGLKELSKELPFLQIIIASRSSKVILNQIDSNHRKYATGKDYLW